MKKKCTEKYLASTRVGVLKKDGPDNDYILKPDGAVWIKVGLFSIRIIDWRIYGRLDVEIYEDGNEAERDAINGCTVRDEEI